MTTFFYPHLVLSSFLCSLSAKKVFWPANKRCLCSLISKNIIDGSVHTCVLIFMAKSGHETFHISIHKSSIKLFLLKSAMKDPFKFCIRVRETDFFVQFSVFWFVKVPHYSSSCFLKLRKIGLQKSEAISLESSKSCLGVEKIKFTQDRHQFCVSIGSFRATTKLGMHFCDASNLFVFGYIIL